MADACLHRGPRIGIAEQQIAGAQLEIGEVERGRRALARGVDAVESLDEIDDLGMQRARHLGAGGVLGDGELILVAGERRGRALQLEGARGRPASRPSRRAGTPTSRSARSPLALGSHRA